VAYRDGYFISIIRSTIREFSETTDEIFRNKFPCKLYLHKMIHITESGNSHESTVGIEFNETGVLCLLRVPMLNQLSDLPGPAFGTIQM
jgi:hypothetical protein